VITGKSPGSRILFAKIPDSFSTAMFNEHDLQDGELKVVDTPQ
jgi:hypothetical protein